MKIEVASTPSWPGFQFVVRAETDADQVILGQVSRALSEKGKGRPWIHGVVYSVDAQAHTSFNFGWLEEKHFQTPQVKKLARKKRVRT